MDVGGGVETLVAMMDPCDDVLGAIKVDLTATRKSDPKNAGPWSVGDEAVDIPGKVEVATGAATHAGRSGANPAGVDVVACLVAVAAGAIAIVPDAVSLSSGNTG